MGKDTERLATGLQQVWDLQLKYKGLEMDAALAAGDMETAGRWAEALMENAAARDAQIAGVRAEADEVPIPGVIGTLPGYGGGPGQDWR